MKYEGKHEKKVILEELKAPEGWAFKEDWEVDMNRAVDEEGKLIRVILSGVRVNTLSLSPSLPPSLSLSLSLSPPSQVGSTQLRLV